MDETYDWGAYAGNLGRFVLPLVAVISPSESQTYLDRTTGYIRSEQFYPWVKQHIGDIDHSVSVTLEDTLLSLKTATGQVPHKKVHADGDVNGNKKIDMAEAIYSLGQLAGSR